MVERCNVERDIKPLINIYIAPFLHGGAWWILKRTPLLLHLLLRSYSSFSFPFLLTFDKVYDLVVQNCIQALQG